MAGSRQRAGAHRFSLATVSSTGWPALLILFAVLMVDVPHRYYQRQQLGWALCSLLALLVALIAFSLYGIRVIEVVPDGPPDMGLGLPPAAPVQQLDIAWCLASWVIILGLAMLPFRIHSAISQGRHRQSQSSPSSTH